MGHTQLEVVGGVCYCQMNGESKLVGAPVKNGPRLALGFL